MAYPDGTPGDPDDPPPSALEIIIPMAAGTLLLVAVVFAVVEWLR